MTNAKPDLDLTDDDGCAYGNVFQRPYDQGRFHTLIGLPGTVHSSRLHVVGCRCLR